MLQSPFLKILKPRCTQRYLTILLTGVRGQNLTISRGAFPPQMFCDSVIELCRKGTLPLAVCFCYKERMYEWQTGTTEAHCYNSALNIHSSCNQRKTEKHQCGWDLVRLVHLNHEQKPQMEFTDCDHLANLSVGNYQSSLREDRRSLSTKCSTRKVRESRIILKRQISNSKGNIKGMVSSN